MNEIRMLRVGAPAALLLPLAVLLLIVVPGPSRAGTTPCACETCHGANHHSGGWTGCTACHQSPPATGSHLAHVDNGDSTSGVAYGDVGTHSLPGAYKFGCGNCHPLDAARHRNGTVEVELYNPTSPAGSMKAMNPSSAGYDGVAKTCANVYCHSGKSLTASGPVGDPLTSPPYSVPPGGTTNLGYIMDSTCSNLLYADYPVVSSRSYATTPAWGTAGALTTCRECHQLPLTTSAPAVDGGAGDTHQWVDAYGYGNLHAYNMSFDPLPCRTCHYATVKDAGTWTRDAKDVTTYGPIPIASHVTHVNGTPDVAFDTVDAVRYRHAFSLAGASWDPATKTCGGVSCHADAATRRYQTNPRWGQPYRWDGPSVECDLCHRMSLDATCTPGR